MRYINSVPNFLIEYCFKTKEFSAFSLPDITNSYDYANLWKNILRIKLKKILRKKNKHINVSITTYNHSDFSIHTENVSLISKNLIDLLYAYLINDSSVLLYIREFDNIYSSYLIIPSDTIICRN